MVECPTELIDGLGAEGVSDIGAVEGDANGALVNGAVVGDVLEVEARDGRPADIDFCTGNFHVTHVRQAGDALFVSTAAGSPATIFVPTEAPAVATSAPTTTAATRNTRTS